jgi:phage recombination protein Bet
MIRMTTATLEPKNAQQPQNAAGTQLAKPTEATFSYTPLGETEAITLTISRVKKFLCTPTRSGKYPTDEDVTKFIMLCKAQGLNPWLNDAYLVGYDSNEGPSFSLITAHQAFLKRAEASKNFEGMESGVVVQAKDGTLTYRPGDLVLDGETLVGGWAKVYRNDRQVQSTDTLKLSTYNTGRSRWKADPAGMIVKCSEASALRKAFPSNLAGMYCREEMSRVLEGEVTVVSQQSQPFASKSESIASQLQSRITTTVLQEKAEQDPSEPEAGGQNAEEVPTTDPPPEPTKEEAAPTLADLMARVAASTRITELHEINDLGKKFLSPEDWEKLGMALHEHQQLIEAQKKEQAASAAKGKDGKLL